MASIVLTSAGSALGGPLGGALGAALGGYLDNKYVYPALGLGTEVPEPPRLGDLQLQSASEGAPVNFCLGIYNRMSGTVIWVSDLIEEKHEEEIGGKGGPGSNIMVYHYFVNIAIAVCEGPVTTIEKVYADGKLFYDDDPDVAFYRADLTATIYSVYRVFGGEDSSTLIYGLIISSPIGGADLSEFHAGHDTVMSGWANAENNGTFECLSSEKFEDGSSEVRLRTVTERKDEAPGEDIVISQTDVPQFSNVQATDVDLYLGTDAQNADPIIEAREGTGDVPGFRGTAYIVIEKLALADFGNRVPQFTFEAKKPARTLQQAIGELVERSGLSAGDYDVSDLSGSIKGLTLSGPSRMTEIIRHLLTAYNVLARESGGKIYFVDRSAITQTDVVAVDMAAHEGGSDTERPAAISDMMGTDLPQTVNVQFIEAASNYQRGSQSESRIQTPAKVIHNIQLPIILTGSEARALAKRILWTMWMNRQTVQFQLPPSYFWVEENDLLGVTIGTQVYSVLVKRVSRGHNFLLDIEGVVEGAYTATQTATADDPAEPSQDVIFVPPGMLLQIIDIAAFSDSENAQAGYYLAACMFSDQAIFSGAAVYSSVDDLTFALLQELSSETTIGTVATALADGESGYWDYENTLDVILLQGELSSKTEIEVLNGQNRALLGQEVIAFRTATLIDTNTYRLSNLLRGLRNTEGKTGSHVTSEIFVHLNSLGVLYKDMNLGSVGVERYFRVGIAGSVVADLTTWEYILAGRNVQPFAPCQVTGVRDASDNLTIRWLRRSRSHVRLFGTNLIPLLEEAENYEIDIYDNGNVVRTIVITAAEQDNTPNLDLERELGFTAAISGYISHVYTAVQQTADGLTPGDPVHAKLYQLSASVGRGRAEDVTI